MLRYQLFPIALRSWTCWQQFTVSPASNEWLKDNVSMNFPIDTSILRTLGWPSQVWGSLIYYYSSQEQFTPYSWTINCTTTESHCHMLSCLFKHLYINQCKFLSSFSFSSVYLLVQHVLPPTTDSTTYE